MQCNFKMTTQTTCNKYGQNRRVDSKKNGQSVRETSKGPTKRSNNNGFIQKMKEKMITQLKKNLNEQKQNQENTMRNKLKEPTLDQGQDG